MVLCFCFVCLRLVCPILPVTLNCPIFIATLVFSNVYCSVHVYIVIPISDSMWAFWVESNMCMFLSFIMYALPLEIQLSIRKGWEPINWFIPTTCVCLYQTRIMIVNSICLSPFFMFNGWRWEVIVRLLILVELLTSLFKISFHNCL